ncbi:MAG: tRNA uridine-5-carboxymethylaminomethyl(34) synthesis enzyme MnmG [Myxococcaceae bacterium]
MRSKYDVIVVGLGHAGCEAASACARMGLSTLGITLKRDRIAVMSCNPAIGGTAKGHLVRELDALGGIMGECADRAGTHFKTLNASKGPAVRASRVLCDRAAYAEEVQTVLNATPNLELHEAEVSDVLVEAGAVRGVRLGDGTEVAAGAVVLTTGTFLQALMHVGEKKEVGGRLGDAAATGLSASLKAIGLELGRFKTGTPARLRRSSIDFSRCEAQPGDEVPHPLSLRTRPPFPRRAQLHCFITHTTSATHSLIQQNLGRSPLYQGQIVGRGPRYCPSLEDKVVRFSDRERHQVFLEPEGNESDLVYPAGLSTSLPADVQLDFLRTIPGLENVEVVRYGYAVEYDFSPPTQLHATLETRKVKGLFLAGQLNGTSGYEEAAIQGLFAGINAGLQLRGEPAFVLGRDEAHGAVLIDDLTTRGVDEPFRMFTSRSEHRLKLREGNAEFRLRSHGHRVGLVTDDELRASLERKVLVDSELARLRRSRLYAQLKRPEVTYAGLRAEDPDRPDLPPDLRDEVETEVKYEGYIAQADRAAAREASGFEHWRIPPTVRFDEVRGLSNEAVEKLSRHRPDTVAQARRIPGLTPAAVSLLLIHLRRSE